MVAWYKRDIPKWMDGTEGLTDGAYRAYDVILNLIYLNEGPIVPNEHGIAGRCKQSIRAFRANLQELLDAGKLTIDNGKLRNARADFELGKVSENRENARTGGENSGKSRRKRAEENNLLKNKDEGQASLKSLGTDKTRLDETIERDSESVANATAPRKVVEKKEKPESLTKQRRKPIEEMTADERAKLAFWERAAGMGIGSSLIARLYNAYGGDKAMAAATRMSSKVLNAIESGQVRDKRSYIGAVISKLGKEDAAHLESWDTSL